MKTRKNISVLWIGIAVLVFFASVSAFKLNASYAIYSASKEHLEHTELEKEYVSEWRKNLNSNLLKQEYSAGNISAAGSDIKRIDIRGMTASPEEDKSFSSDEVIFSVIKY